MAAPYLVHSTPGCVEVWSTVRLPFEPRGWLLDMRNDLKVALQELSHCSSGRLHALYCAADDGAFVDIENVLLYNVGGKALGILTKNSVTLERGFHVPIPPPGFGHEEGQSLHYHRYSEAGDAPRAPWEPGRLLGAFSDVPVAALDKPAPVWKAIRKNTVAPSRTVPLPVRFLIHVQIIDTLSREPAGSVSRIIKPVLDGVISAYHSHVGSDGCCEAQRLEGVGLGTELELREMLFDPDWSALGPRRLVKPFGASGVQWNPADDFCIFAHVTLQGGGDGHSAKHPTRWQLSGEVREAAQGNQT